MTRAHRILVAALVALALAAPGCRSRTAQPRKDEAVRAPQSAPADPVAERLKTAVGALESLHKRMGEPQPGDWLATYKEAGQTFAEYLAARPTLPAGERRILYIQPLGPFTATQRKVVRLAASYMEAFFNLPVKLLSDKPLPPIPREARRNHPARGNPQILAGFLTMKVLRPTLPPDAHAMIAFTASDLYPDETMNFVFGQASLSERVGVWSLYRLGEPDRNDEEFRRFLLRTLKIASHETGHMFSIPHCTKYECVMNGTNHLGETDRHPLDACPECMAKLCWATNCNPRARYEKLAAFCSAQGLTREAKFFEREAAAVQSLYPD